MAKAPNKSQAGEQDQHEQETQNNGGKPEGDEGGEGNKSDEGDKPEGDEPEPEGKTQNSVQTDGVRARRGLTQKMLLPDQDFIAKNIVAGGKGTRATIGRVYGVVTKAERRQNTFNDKIIESIVLTGMFDMESYITGEISRGSSWHPPMAYGEMVEAAFKADKLLLSVDVDCDVGLEATGKTIAYEWVTTAFREGEEMSTLKRLKATRARPTSLLLTAAGEPAQLQLTAPAK